ncbi:glutathione S-transferase family protein [soil metagenome]
MRGDQAPYSGVMYDLYIANKNYSSWSLRPWLLMRMLEIGFREQFRPFGHGAPFTDFSPSGLVPCRVDGDQAVWDTLAITEYLAERHAGVWSGASPARTWSRCASAEMHSGFSHLRNHYSMSCGVRIRANAPSAGLTRDLGRVDALWNQGLARFGGPFLAGDRFTAVDAFYAPVAFRFQSYGHALTGRAVDYLALLLDLAPMREWYEAALVEWWRDEQHEIEMNSAGVLLQDFRTSQLPR